jgi:hypothetical protein
MEGPRKTTSSYQPASIQRAISLILIINGTTASWEPKLSAGDFDHTTFGLIFLEVSNITCYRTSYERCVQPHHSHGRDSVYMFPTVTRWPNYIPGHRDHFLSPSTNPCPMVQTFEPASTGDIHCVRRERYIELSTELHVGLWRVSLPMRWIHFSIDGIFPVVLWSWDRLCF